MSRPTPRPAPSPGLRDGDLIFQRSQSRQSQAIALATKSPYTHVGVIVHLRGAPMVFEAVSPVKLTPLDAWVARGKDQHYVVKRLRDHPTGLPAEVVDAMKTQARAWRGRSYDWAFEWSDTRLYCSELVWKLYDRAMNVQLCPLRTLADFELDAPVVRSKLRERYGDAPPLDAKVVAPSDLFGSEHLVTVQS